MKNLTIRNITRVTGGRYTGPEEILDREVESVITDSRKIESGCLFIPIAGARVDAHDFIPEVMEKGALVTLSEKELPGSDFPWIKVESSLSAIQDLAAFYLESLQIPVVGITGSVGKTSTKEAIASVLQQRFRVLKTLGNFNNELGMPFTIFRLREEDQIAVLEMGISHFGEMTKLARIARPDTVVITNIGNCHLEFLGDRDGVLKAKTEILDFMNKDGHIILNGDDDRLRTIRESHGILPVFYSVRSDHAGTFVRPMEEKREYYADSLENLGLDGTRVKLHLGDETIQMTIPVPGRHMIYNALAAAAVGKCYGLTSEEIRRGIESFETIDGRFHIIRKPAWTIIDDCYNANPMSMKAALDILKEIPGRRTAILGDMGELGSDEAEFHREIGCYAVQAGVDQLICIGALSKQMAEEAVRAAAEISSPTRVYWEAGVEEFLQKTEQYLEAGDTILVKASHFMEFGRIVEKLSEKGD